jgi:hypothetical protein
MEIQLSSVEPLMDSKIWLRCDVPEGQKVGGPDGQMIGGLLADFGECDRENKTPPV